MGNQRLQPLRILGPFLVLLLAGCGQSFQPSLPRLPSPSPGLTADAAASLRFHRQFSQNRDLPLDHQRHIVILIMTPAYETLRQIAAGNMGHAAIEINGRLYDMGSRNGYAFAFAPTPGLPDWSFPNAQIALAQLTGHPDSDGYLDQIIRFDVTITDDQVNRLQSWWTQMDSAMSDPANTLYSWTGWQCASTVGRCLRDAGVTIKSPNTPDDLMDYYSHHLRNTSGPSAGRLAAITIVQHAAHLKNQNPRDDTSPFRTILQFPRIFLAGTRSTIFVNDMDNKPRQILWSDTPEYLRQIKTAALSPAQAVRRTVDLNSIQGAQAVPNFMLGRWYHVDADHVIGQASLAGWYINADTGQIIHRQDSRVIRFDLFDGDRLVQGWKDLRSPTGPLQ